MLLADLTLALLLPGRVRRRNGSLPGVRPPMPVPRRGASGSVASFLWRLAGAGHVQETHWTLPRVSLCSHGSVHEGHGRSTAALRGFLSAQQPRYQACILNAQGGMEMLNRIDGADTLFSIGLRGGYMQVRM